MLQHRRECEAQERRRRLADRRASLSDEALAAVKRRAEAALAADGVARTHLGYNVLVKLRMDELLLNDLDEDGVPKAEPVLGALAAKERHGEGV